MELRDAHVRHTVHQQLRRHARDLDDRPHEIELEQLGVPGPAHGDLHVRARRAPQALDQLVERLGHQVSIVTGSPINLKITTREDLRLAEKALAALPKPKFQVPAHPFKDDEMWR